MRPGAGRDTADPGPRKVAGRPVCLAPGEGVGHICRTGLCACVSWGPCGHEGVKRTP